MKIITQKALLIWTLLIFILSVLPGKDLPSYTFWEFLTLDKIGHWFFYGIHCLIIIKLFIIQNINIKRNKIYFFSFLISCAYGILMEIIQGAFFESRVADYKDVIANTIGIIIAILISPKTENPEKFYLMIKNLFKKNGLS